MRRQSRGERIRRRKARIRKDKEREQKQREHEAEMAKTLEELETRPLRRTLALSNTSFRSSPQHEAPKIAGAKCVGAWKNPARNSAYMEHLGNIVEAWHGTVVDCVPSIAADTLRRGSWGLFGGGIYTTPSIGKAMNYARLDDTGDKGRPHFFLLRCRVALGNTYNTNSRMTERNLPEGYHSISAGKGSLQGAWGGRLREGEYVVYHSDQVIVERVFEYALVEGWKEPPPPPLPPPPPVPAWKKNHPCLIRGYLCRNVKPKEMSGRCLIGLPVSNLLCSNYQKGEKISA